MLSTMVNNLTPSSSSRSRSAPANHVRRLLLLLSVAGAGAATCPDGTGGLTKALYDAGDPAAYAQVTCVPANEFSYYDGDVTLTGLAMLEIFENHAFYKMTGVLTISGLYPALKMIGERAFWGHGGTTTSSITFNSGLPLLVTISDRAFYAFKGTIALMGPFPSLESIGISAFYGATTASSITFDSGLPSLATISDYAFYYFLGTIELTGSFPSLESIGYSAFNAAGNAGNTVAIACSSPAGPLKIGSKVFYNFKGNHNDAGEQKDCTTSDITASGISSPVAASTTTTTTTALNKCPDGGNHSTAGEQTPCTTSAPTSTATATTTTATTVTTTAVKGKTVGEAAGSTESPLDGKVQAAIQPDPNSPPEEAVEPRTPAGADDAPADTKQSSAGMIAAVVITVAVLAAIIGAVVLRKRPQMPQDEIDAADGAAAAAAAATTTNAAYTHFAPRAAGKGGNASSEGQLQANSSYYEGLCLAPTLQQGGGGHQSGPYLEPVGYNGSVSDGAYSEVNGTIAMCSDTVADYAEVGGGGGGDRGAYLVPTPLAATGDALHHTAADGSAGMESGAYYATVANAGASSKQQADPHYYEYADAAAMMALAGAGAGAGAGASPTYAIPTDDASSTATYDVASNDVGGAMYTYDVASSNDDVGAAAAYDVAPSTDDGYLAVGDGRSGSDASKMRDVEGLYDTNVGRDSDFC